MNIKQTILCIFILLSITNCTQNNVSKTSADDSNTEIKLPKELQDSLIKTAENQSKGFVAAIAKIHRVFEYNGHSYLTPNANAKLIAVDLELSGYSKDFDIDDIDVLDGLSGKSYGSDPDIGLLTSSGLIADNESNWPASPGPLRVLLVYGVPKNIQSIKLSYWDQEMTVKPSKISGSGPSLRKPKN